MKITLKITFQDPQNKRWVKKKFQRGSISKLELTKDLRKMFKGTIKQALVHSSVGMENKKKSLVDAKLYKEIILQKFSQEIIME